MITKIKEFIIKYKRFIPLHERILDETYFGKNKTTFIKDDDRI